jgi:hypothetical protein
MSVVSSSIFLMVLSRMMSIDEAIKRRWSVRTYKIDDVEKDLVRECIKAAPLHLA